MYFGFVLVTDTIAGGAIVTSLSGGLCVHSPAVFCTASIM
jgi:hypothetical protein